jgi:selenocysteine-specific elongation factor
LARISRQGLIVKVSQTRFFLPHVLRRLAQIAQDLAERSPTGLVTAGAFKDSSGIGRNLAIEVLEFFDRMIFTRRDGDARRVLRRAREVFVDMERAADI